MHYVYAHSLATTGEIFYIGKGSAKRAWSHYSRSKRWHNKVKKHGYDVHILEHHQDLNTAYQRENELVLEGFALGLPLVNMNYGGSGNRGLKHSKQTREKRNASLKNTWKCPQRRAALSAAQVKSHSNPEVKARRCAAMKGIVKHESWRKALSVSLTGKEKSVEHKSSLGKSMHSKFSAFKVYCQEHGIKHPGSGYVNIDHAKAKAWCKEQGLL
jgi:hypothetical protein